MQYLCGIVNLISLSKPIRDSSINKQKLLAIDPSLTASGWALFSIQTGLPISLGVISPPGTKVSLSIRMSILQDKVTELFSLIKMESGDILVCEGPAPLVHNPDSALKVERVRSIFESVARSIGVLVPGRLNPRTVQHELLGMSGVQLSRKIVKASARDIVFKLYNLDLKGLTRYVESKKKELTQDEIDALLIGSLAVSRVKMSISTKIAIEQLFESNKRRKSISSWREIDIQNSRSV